MESITKEMRFGMTEVERLQTLRNVTRLMEFDFKLQCTERTMEDTGTGDKVRLPGSYPR